VLLPGALAPTIVSASSVNTAQLDALLVIVPHPPPARAFGHLPESARWRALDARAAARAGTVRTTSLGNRRQTLAVLGYLAPDASAFERLSLAGRMLKEAAARCPGSIGLGATGPASAARAALDALLAAACAHAFALPNFRAPVRGQQHLRRVVLLDGAGLDVRYATAAALADGPAAQRARRRRLPARDQRPRPRTRPVHALARQPRAAPPWRQRISRGGGRQR
jgi:hypothetical protein